MCRCSNRQLSIVIWKISGSTSRVRERRNKLIKLNKFSSLFLSQNCLTSIYIQSWRFGRFAGLAWIKYKKQDKSWRFENRSDFVYKYLKILRKTSLWRITQNILNPFGFFLSEWCFGEATWCGWEVLSKRAARKCMRCTDVSVIIGSSVSLTLMQWRNTLLWKVLRSIFPATT